MQFDERNGEIGGTSDIVLTQNKFGKNSDSDSLVSGHSQSRLVRKANLEIVWQKANSINGIRKMNMQFKEERRMYQPTNKYLEITQEYW